MALADLAREHTGTVPWRTCQVCHALRTIPEADADGVRAALSDPTYHYSKLQARLASDPHTPLVLEYSAIRRHARAKSGPCVESGGQRAGA